MAEIETARMTDDETREYLRKSGVPDDQLDRGVAMVNEILEGPPVASPEPRTVYLQWKGTESCIDFECACGKDYHFDGRTWGGLKCTACGRCYRIDHTIPVTEVPEADWWGRELDQTHSDDDWESIPVDVDALKAGSDE